MANTTQHPFFSGNIGDAIVHSKSQNFPLVVAIQGDDNDSKRLDSETWTNPPVIELLGKESIALKLVWNTEDAKNFYSIYPVLNVPTVYIISPTNGAPLKVLTGFFDSQSFLNHFNESQELLKKGSTVSVAPSSPVTPLTKEEQQQRMKEKLEEIRMKKEEEEKKAEKERELSRRQSGKELQKAVTQIKQSQQTRDIQERQREKEAEKLARQKVKEQLERDKAERRARMEQSKPAAQAIPAAKIPKTSHNIAEVAFKMIDGSTLRKEFQPNDKVQDLYQFVKQNSSLRSFELSTSFPRKILGAHDMSKTLLECDLVPNGTIMVMSFDTAPSHSSPSLATAGWMDTAYSYWDWMYSGVTGWVWGSALPPNSHLQQQSNGPQPVNASRQTSQNNTSHRRNNPRLGTVGGLSSDDPDRNSYWNGNSTQQQ